uniref:3-methyl-2-oxobutanoate hydroxymethyltransferase n=1 Tax=Arundo donax TaxID=35708 RepID=A0A0A9EEQ8_ARUDO
MMSSEMGSVVSWPWTTMAAESPTRQTSIPAESTWTAEG